MRNQHVLLLLFDDVIDHSLQSLVASRLLFQNNVLLISCLHMLHECRPFLRSRSYKFSGTCSSKSRPWDGKAFFPGLIEGLGVVFVQLDIKEVTQGHRVPQSLMDVDEQKYLKRNLPARKHRTFVFVLSFLQEIDLSLEICCNHHRDSFDNL